jgi:hypothetical protein
MQAFNGCRWRCQHSREIERPEICKSEAMYGVDNAIQKTNGESWVTIRNMTVCINHPVKFKEGDTIVVEVAYDFDMHPRYVALHCANVLPDANSIMVR